MLSVHSRTTVYPQPSWNIPAVIKVPNHLPCSGSHSVSPFQGLCFCTCSGSPDSLTPPSPMDFSSIQTPPCLSYQEKILSGWQLPSLSPPPTLSLLLRFVHIKSSSKKVLELFVSCCHPFSIFVSTHASQARLHHFTATSLVTVIAHLWSNSTSCLWHSWPFSLFSWLLEATQDSPDPPPKCPLRLLSSAGRWHAPEPCPEHLFLVSASFQRVSFWCHWFLCFLCFSMSSVSALIFTMSFLPLSLCLPCSLSLERDLNLFSLLSKTHELILSPSFSNLCHQGNKFSS